MSKMKEKIAYFKGLKDGVELKDQGAEKLFAAVYEALNAIAQNVAENEAMIDELDECIDDIYDTIDEFEDYDDSDCDCDCDDPCCECGCHDIEDDFVEIPCPHCSETIFFDKDMLLKEDGVMCPSCNKGIQIELDLDDDGCACGCCCEDHEESDDE